MLSASPMHCDVCNIYLCKACRLLIAFLGGLWERYGLPGGGGGGRVEGFEEGEGALECVVVCCLESGCEHMAERSVLTLCRRRGCRGSCSHVWGECRRGRRITFRRLAPVTAGVTTSVQSHVIPTWFPPMTRPAFNVFVTTSTVVLGFTY